MAGLSCCCAVARFGCCCPFYLKWRRDSEVRTREKKDAVQNKQAASITAFPFESYTLYFFRLGPLSPEIPTIYSIFKFSNIGKLYCTFPWSWVFMMPNLWIGSLHKN